MKEQGKKLYTINEVAEIYGVSRQAVRYWLERFDVPVKIAILSGRRPSYLIDIGILDEYRNLKKEDDRLMPISEWRKEFSKKRKKK